MASGGPPVGKAGGRAASKGAGRLPSPGAHGGHKGPGHGQTRMAAPPHDGSHQGHDGAHKGQEHHGRPHGGAGSAAADAAGLPGADAARAGRRPGAGHGATAKQRHSKADMLDKLGHHNGGGEHHRGKLATAAHAAERVAVETAKAIETEGESLLKYVKPLLIGLIGVMVVIGLILALVIFGAWAGLQEGAGGSACVPAAGETPPMANPGTGDGRTLHGRVSWFGGPNDAMAGDQTATGVSTSEPGVAVYNQKTLGGYWQIRFPNRRVVALKQTDIGPAPWTKRVLDVTYSALAQIGYTEQSFPTDARVDATYLGKSAPECTLSGSADDIRKAADELDRMRVPYVLGGGHMTPARPDPGLDCSSSVSWVFQHAGFKVPTMISDGYMTWGDPGPGQQITIYTRPNRPGEIGHIFMRIGNRYFGTSGSFHRAAGTGPAWFTTNPPKSYLDGFTTRHPPGQ